MRKFFVVCVVGAHVLFPHTVRADRVSDFINLAWGYYKANYDANFKRPICPVAELDKDIEQAHRDLIKDGAELEQVRGDTSVAALRAALILRASIAVLEETMHRCHEHLLANNRGRDLKKFLAQIEPLK